jgi:hypothetical protein
LVGSVRLQLSTSIIRLETIAFGTFVIVKTINTAITATITTTTASAIVTIIIIADVQGVKVHVM